MRPFAVVGSTRPQKVAPLVIGSNARTKIANTQNSVNDGGHACQIVDIGLDQPVKSQKSPAYSSRYGPADTHREGE